MLFCMARDILSANIMREEAEESEEKKEKEQQEQQKKEEKKQQNLDLETVSYRNGEENETHKKLDDIPEEIPLAKAID